MSPMSNPARRALLALWALSCGSPSEVETAPEPEAHHGDQPEEVVLSPTALANARLVVAPLAPSALSTDVTVTARVTLDPRRDAHVAAVTAGTVEKILVRPGDRVRTGDPLATVLSPDLGAAIGDHLSASARMEAARARRDRLTTLRDGGFSSAAEGLDADANYTVAAADAEAAEERLRVFGVAPERVRPNAGEHFSSRFSVRSPVDGEVFAVQVALGASVTSGDALFHVGNLDEVWLILDVYERNLAAVTVGAAVSFTADAYGDEVFVGRVDQIGAWLDPVSRTTEVRVVVPNTDHRLKPNMFASAHLALGGSDEQGLVLPGDAVQEVEGKPCVFVEEGPGRFVARPVRTTPLADGRLRVVAGVSAGDRVVSEGAFTLKSELAKGELGEGHAD